MQKRFQVLNRHAARQGSTVGHNNSSVGCDSSAQNLASGCDIPPLLLSSAPADGHRLHITRRVGNIHRHKAILDDSGIQSCNHKETLFGEHSGNS